MKISKGRLEDNYKLYKKSILMYEKLNKIIKNVLKENDYIGGYFGVIDAWCLLTVQYFLNKKDFLIVPDNLPRPLDYSEFRDFLSNGYYNIHCHHTKLNHSDKIITKEKIFTYNNNLFDDKRVVASISHNKKFETFEVQSIISRLDCDINEGVLINLSEKISYFLKEFYDKNDIFEISNFIINSMPQFYLQKINQSKIYGFSKVINQNIFSFIRTTKSTIDSDLLKILGAEIKENNAILYSIVHGGNNDEIAYNSQYKIDNCLSQNLIKLSDFQFSLNIFKISKKFLIRKGIVLYLAPRILQNLYMMGSETNEDFPKYIDNLAQFLRKANQRIKKELIIMRHNDKNIVNLYELNFHINKRKIYSYNSIFKKLYRRFFVPRLQIATYPGTVMIESIYSDIPCLLYINPERILFSDEMKRIMDSLIEAGIVHTTPESLVNFLTNVNDFEAWWRKEKTINQINKFKYIMKSCFLYN